MPFSLTPYDPPTHSHHTIHQHTHTIRSTNTLTSYDPPTHSHHTIHQHTHTTHIHTNKPRLTKLIHVQSRCFQLVVNEQPVTQIETLPRVCVTVEIGENQRNVLTKQNHMNLFVTPILHFPHNCNPLSQDTGSAPKSESAPHDQNQTQCHTRLGLHKCHPP